MSTRPPYQAEAAIIGPTSNLVRRVEIYEPDGVTKWKGGLYDNRLIDGSVAVDYSRPERRVIDSLQLENGDRALQHDPAGFWYDKILKIFTGVSYYDTTPVTSYRVRTNLCTNPSFETNLTGWTASGGTIARDTTSFRWGSASMRLDTTAAAQSVQMSARPAIAPESRVACSVWVRGTGTAKLELRAQTSGNTLSVTAFSPDVPLTGQWQQITVILDTFVDSVKVLPIVSQVAGGNNSIWIDGALVETGPKVTGNTFDGSTLNFANRAYVWTGTPHASTSTETTTIQTPTTQQKIWETQIGEFMIDSISEDHFPFTIKITGRDYTKKCMLSKFVNATAFAKNTKVEAVIKSIAQNAGITKFILPSTPYSLDTDYFFERNTPRWDAMFKIASAFGYELFFDSQGYLVMREFQDPISAPLAYVLETGALGTLVTFSKSTNDTRIFNHIIVTGESSDAALIPVMREAKNTEPSSPTRIARLGDRVWQYSSAFVTTAAQAQDLANKYLRIMGLEEFDLNFSAISLPWLEVGEIVQFNDPRENRGQPTRFLLSSLSIPLGLGAMSGNAKRVSVVS